MVVFRIVLSHVLPIGEVKRNKPYLFHTTSIDIMLKVYTSEGCSACARVKAYLSSKGVSYEEIDVFKDKQATEFMAKGGLVSVPIICKDKTCVVGFDEKGIEAVIKDGG